MATLLEELLPIRNLDPGLLLAEVQVAAGL